MLPRFKTTYFTTPAGVHVASIGKSGSTSLGKTILEVLWPEKVPTMVGYDSSNRPGWQGFCPKVEEPVDPLIPVRDPIERFRSACAQMRVTADEALAKLASDQRFPQNYHFRRTVEYLAPGQTCKLYKFPEHTSELAAALGLSALPVVNDSESNNPGKPDLTAEQTSEVETYYAEDIALYQSITAAGQELVVPLPEPEPEPVPYVAEVLMVQLKTQLLFETYGESNLLTTVETLINGMSEGDFKAEFKLWFDNAPFARQDNPRINALQAQLGISDEDKRRIWHEASQRL